MQATRIGDTTSGLCNPGFECCPHGRNGINSTGSPNVFINKIKVHRRADLGDCRCPHGGTFQSVGSSKTVFANGRGITRISDQTICLVCGCSGSHSSGSPNVFVG